ncbi:MAG TPA: PEGA domain-containing protein [Polyangiaceae bacterium]|nr:PEGA domain-containing protein [Polyangiaceae bacterium]
MAKLPLSAPLEVASGSHVVCVVAPGYAPARREVTVAGKQTVPIALELVAIEELLAHIAVHCRVAVAMRRANGYTPIIPDGTGKAL